MPDTPFLCCLPEDDKAALVDRLAIQSHSRDEILISQDEVTQDVFFVMEGLARANVFSEDGKIVAYRDIQPGAIFGELSAIDGAPRSATVVAVDDVKVGRLGHAEFCRLVETKPEFQWALLRYLAGQARAMTARIFEYSTMLVRERLVQELIRLGEAASDPGDPPDRVVEIRPGPTHFDLANRISTHREAVSREMSQLTKQQVIGKTKNGAMPVNLDALRAIGRRSV